MSKLITSNSYRPTVNAVDDQILCCIIWLKIGFCIIGDAPQPFPWSILLYWKHTLQIMRPRHISPMKY